MSFRFITCRPQYKKDGVIEIDYLIISAVIKKLSLT